MQTSGTDPSKKYLTQNELLERWRQEIKLATLTTWRSRRQGPPYVKVGGKVLYPLAGVEEYEKKNSR
jgi:hypothetical protein